jgi:protein dithiol oxidoreductase (disulfide-forming)
MKRLALLCVALLGPALALPAKAQLLWVEGEHYERINPVVPPTTPGKVEVTEVFSYGCPYCYAALPLAERIKASLPPYAQMNYVHASFVPAEAWPMFQRAYLTAKAMGIAEANHQAFFEAIWETGEMPLLDPNTHRPVQPLPNIAYAAKFYAKHAGIKEEDFLARSRQPDIDEAVTRSDALVKAWAVPGTPSFIINGKYRTGRGIKTSDDMVRVIQYLVALEKPKG